MRAQGWLQSGEFFNVGIRAWRAFPSNVELDAPFGTFTVARDREIEIVEGNNIVTIGAVRLVDGVLAAA